MVHLISHFTVNLTTISHLNAKLIICLDPNAELLGGKTLDTNLTPFFFSGVKMFFVSDQGHVTTLSQTQTLYAYQFVNYEQGTCNCYMFYCCMYKVHQYHTHLLSPCSDFSLFLKVEEVSSCVLYVYCVCIVGVLYVYCMCVVGVMYVYCMCIVGVMYVHCMCIVGEIARV